MSLVYIGRAYLVTVAVCEFENKQFVKHNVDKLWNIPNFSIYFTTNGNIMNKVSVALN